MKIAFIHDWLIGMRGGEKVLEAACELYPDAEIFTLLYNPDRVSEKIRRRKVHSSWLQKLPAVYRYYRNLLPLMTRAVQGWDLSRFDAVISFSHCVAKGARVRGTHVCYCFTPMRYVYSQFDNYFPNGSRPWAKRLAELIRPFLIRWDRGSSRGVHHFVACSENVRRRVQETYGRDSQVIYPPVDTEFYTPAAHGAGSRERFYLAVGALVPYKRIDLAIEACRLVGAKLKIVGVGTEENRLKALAAGADIEFLGWTGADALRDLYQNCEALLFPQDEDFGIAAVEAQACGRPVIAYARGGALETVRDGVSGLFFREQTPQSLASAMREAKAIAWDIGAIRANARRFDHENFKIQLAEFVRRTCGANSKAVAPKPVAA